jgi:hypothetical protein
MIKLLKAGFWFGLVLYFLPLGEETRTLPRGLPTLDAILAANIAADEISRFCGHRPDLCDEGIGTLEKAASVSLERLQSAPPPSNAVPNGELTVEDIIAASGE